MGDDGQPWMLIGLSWEHKQNKSMDFTFLFPSVVIEYIALS